MNVRWIVELTDDERATLRQFTTSGSTKVRKIKRALILLAADNGMTDAEITTSIDVGTSTVYRVKRAFVEEGLENALEEEPRPGGKRKLSCSEEALLIATTCSLPPLGRSRWTLELLAGEMVRLTDHSAISAETVRRRLAENDLKPWQKKMWCIPEVNGEYVARMEDILDLYTETPNPSKPVVSFDESPLQLIGETRVPIPAQPGKPARIDYEYRRNGTANLFVFVDAHAPWRHVKVTDHRNATDFAECMRDLVDVNYPHAPLIRIVLDNLSTHRIAALYQAFSPDEARRIARRLELHHTPKHASWLNMVEIEIGVLKRQCLDRRIEDRMTLEREIAAWQAARNASGAKIQWLFDVARAREKMRHAYPKPATIDEANEAMPLAAE
jgi:transposase